VTRLWVGKQRSRGSNTSRTKSFLFSECPDPHLGLPSLVVKEYRSWVSVIKWLGHVADHSHTSDADAKNDLICTSVPHSPA
jgi:hypothetical protein